MSGDYLEAAKQALEDGMDMHDDERVRYAEVHALVAIAEGLRALVGVIASIPVEEVPGGDGRD